MPFQFVHLCDLLEKLENYSTRDPPFPVKTLAQLYRREIEWWFSTHRVHIDSCRLVLLTALFPERRTDRVYGIKEKTLARILGRVLHLGVSRIKELSKWTVPGYGDLGVCVERVQMQAEMPTAMREVTLEEIDRALETIAGGYRFSSPDVRSKVPPHVQRNPERILAQVFVRLQSREAKWFTRMILKSYFPVLIPEHVTFRAYHFLLPAILKIQSSFRDAIDLLDRAANNPILKIPPKPPHGMKQNMFQIAMKYFEPRIGVKVGRHTFFKARSTKHCLQMANRRRMSLERKYDGEYCQIHVDLSRGDNWLQIFSKSGKDSTQDRQRVHEVIHKCLRIGQPDCKFISRCILEGELLVFNDKDQRILGFHKIRKHVSRSGSFIGTEKDSQAHEFEHLMIAFFDVLLIDHEPILAKKYDERRKDLEALIAVSYGRAELAFRQEINFSFSNALSQLREAFSKGIASRWEGLVLKPCDDPYFIWREETKGPGDFKGCWIKLKKDYITGMGDEADFAIVGAGYDCNKAQGLVGVKPLRWTTFHIACLENKIDVIRFGSKPRYKVVDALSETIRTNDIQKLNETGQFTSKAFGQAGTYEEGDFEVDERLKCSMSIYFTTPFIVEVIGGGYEKLSNTTYWTLRWPRVTRIHWDRTFQDTIDFTEFQERAERAVNQPIDGADEDKAWLDLLEQADLGKKVADATLDVSSAQSMALDGTLTRGNGPPRKRRRAESFITNLVRVDTPDQFLDDNSGISGGPSKRTKHVDVPRSPLLSSLTDNQKYTLQNQGETSDSLEVNTEESGFETFDQEFQGQGMPVPPPAPPNIPSTSLTTALADITNASPQRHSNNNHNGRTEGKGCLSESQGNEKSGSHRSVAAIPLQISTSSPIKFGTGVCARCPRAIFRSSGFAVGPSPPSPVPDVCPLKNTIILLSPCAAGMAYLTEDLLPAHGATFFPVSEHKGIIDAGLVGERKRRLILIADNRCEATEEVVRAVKELEYSERIEIYDWRLLEEVTKYEKGEKTDREWREHLVCEV